MTISATAAIGQSPALDDPLPIRRILLPLSKGGAEAFKGKPDAFMLLPRNDFEDKIQKAARAALATKNVPRLVEASYVAEVNGDMLVNGRAAWKVVNSVSEQSVLPLSNLNLAIDKFSGDGFVGEFTNSRVGSAHHPLRWAVPTLLLVKKTGLQVFDFEWSLRGRPGPGGTHFELDTPSCPVSSLDLLVPNGYDVTTVQPGLLSTPTESEKPGYTKQRIQFIADSPLQFTIRRPLLAGEMKSSLLVKAKTRQQLLPGHVLSEHEFSIETLRSDLTELSFDCSSNLHPFDVTGKSLEIAAWELTRSQADESSPRRLTVRLKPGTNTKAETILIRATAPHERDSRWTSPAIILSESILLGEMLTVSIHADVRLEGLAPGGFQVTRAVSEADGAQSITLVDTGAGSHLRPSGVVRFAEPKGRVNQVTRWHPGLSTHTATIDLALNISEGKLFQLSCKLPKSAKRWQVESVDVSPKSLLRGWTVVGQSLIVDLHRPLTARESGTFKVKLTSAQGAPAANGIVLDFPDLEPSAFLARLGTLEIHVVPTLQAVIIQSSATAAPATAPIPGSPTFVFPFRGQAVAGKLRLAPQIGMPATGVETITVAKSPEAAPEKLSEPSAIDAQQAATEPAAEFDEGRLITSAVRGENLRHQFEFVVSRWHAPLLAVTLPAFTAKVLSVTVDGQWVDPPLRIDEGVRVQVPVIGNSKRNRIQMVYATKPFEGLLPWATLEADAPALPLPLKELRRTWRLPEGFSPLDQESLRMRKHDERAEAITLSSLAKKLWYGGEHVLWSNRVSEAKQASKAAEPSPQPLSLRERGWGEGERFVDWEERPGPDTARVVIVSLGFTRWLGVLIACAVITGAWRIGPGLSAAWRVWLYLASLTVTGSATLWLPEAFRQTALLPLVAAIGVGVVWYAAALARIRPAARSVTTQKIAKSSMTTGLFLLVACFAVGFPAYSQEQSPFAVYILGDPLDSEKQTVLAPTELLKRLDAISASRAVLSEGAALVSAVYSGKVSGKLANFVGEFKVVSLWDKAELHVALDGIDLQENARVDGELVYPSPGAKGGYTVTVSGKGIHSLVIPFAVRLTTRKEEQFLKFAIPPISQSRLEFVLPSGAKSAQLLSGFGESKVGANAISGSLGRDGTVSIVWTTDAVAAPMTTAREGYLWDLLSGATLLTAKYRLSAAGKTSSLSLLVPEEFEVRAVEVRTEGADGESSRLVPLRGASFVGKGPARQMRVDFHEPALGSLELTLRLLRSNPSLKQAGTRQSRIPRLQGAKMTEGVMTFRTDGPPHSVHGQNLALTPISREAFAKFWQDTADFASVFSTYSFRRSGGAPVITTMPLAPKPKAEQKITWHVDSDLSNFSAEMKLEFGNAESTLALVEVPDPVTIWNVEGPHLFSWNRQGSLVQVWLSQPQKETNLTISGFSKNTIRASALKDGRFVLPRIRIANAQTTTLLQLPSSADVSLDLLASKHLAKSGTGTDPSSLDFVAAQPQYEAALRIRRLPVSPYVNTVTRLEAKPDGLYFAAEIECHVPAGNAQSLLVTLRDWPAEANVDLPRGIQKVEIPERNGDRVWKVTFPAGLGQHAVLRIHGRHSLSGWEPMTVPKLRIDGATTQTQWIAIAGDALEVEDSQHLAAVTKPDTLPPRLSTPFLKHVWTVQDPTWELTVKPRPIPSLSPSPSPSPSPTPSPSGSRVGVGEGEGVRDGEGVREKTEPENEHAVLEWGALATGVLILGILLHLPSVLSWLRLLWPEQILLLALVGWLLLGPSVLGGLFFAIALGARIIISIRFFTPGVREPAQPTS